MAAQRKSNILDIVSTNDATQGDTANQTVEPGRRGRPRSVQVRAAVVRAAAQLTRAGGPAHGDSSPRPDDSERTKR